MSNTKDALKHYGYPEDTPDKDVGIGLWDKSDALDRLAKLPEMLPHLDGNKKIRVVFDYDPDFPKALLQITGLKDNDCVVHSDGLQLHPDGYTEELSKSSAEFQLTSRPTSTGAFGTRPDICGFENTRLQRNAAPSTRS